MSKPAPQREIAYRTGEAPPWLTDGDGRHSCAGCRNKSAGMCVTFRTSHVPVHLVHLCTGYSPKR